MALLIRLLFLAVMVWFGYRLVRQIMGGNQPLPPGSAGNSTPGPAASPEPMQRCAHCGVHLPVGESTHSRGQVFCSESHRDAWLRDHPQV